MCLSAVAIVSVASTPNCFIWRKLMSKMIAAVALVAVVLTGCNTVKGFGEDVQRGGEKVQGAAAETQQKM
jgi:entericidin B